MGYRLEWRLLGREDRLLDKGEIDSGFRDRPAALQALSAFLAQFPVWGRTAGNGGWWAQRSPDADLKVLVTLDEQGPLEEAMTPAMWASGSGERTPLQA
jgi:hypothetical protein